jgi:hypothetical protein
VWSKSFNRFLMAKSAYYLEIISTAMPSCPLSRFRVYPNVHKKHRADISHGFSRWTMYLLELRIGSPILLILSASPHNAGRPELVLSSHGGCPEWGDTFSWWGLVVVSDA